MTRSPHSPTRICENIIIRAEQRSGTSCSSVRRQIEFDSSRADMAFSGGMAFIH